MNGQGDGSGTEDRRAGGRQPVAREALFSGALESGPLHEATATNVGAEGLQLRTAHRVRPGERLQVELHPAAGIGHGAPMLLEGTVVYCREIAGGAFEAGLRFPTRLPAGTQDAGSMFLDAAREANAELPARFASGGRDSRRRRWRWLAALALLLLAALFGGLAGLTLLDAPEAALPAGRSGEGDSSAGLIAMHARLTKDDAEAAPLTARTLFLVDALRPFFPEATPPATIDEAYALLVAGRLEAARAAFVAIGETPGLTPVERFRVKLGTAQSLASLGQRATATALSIALLAESTPAIPAPWREAASRLNEVLALGRLELDAQLLSSDLAFGSQSPAHADPQPPAEGVFIDVDKSDFTLTVFRDGKREASYPIGVGAEGTTPEGRFTIANKIDRPTWYNKGDPVAPGDPRNPLGDHWLGLAAERLATAYGIHGTSEPSSIGGEASAGCIRMRPEDVAAVFEAAEVGTPVYIRP